MLRICSFLLFAATLSAQSADWIWSARYVITEDAQHRVIEDGAVAIRADRIVGVGTRAEIDARFQAAHRLDRPDAILAPGLIDTHTHAAMSLFRGIADDKKLQDWLNNYIFPAEAKNVTPDFVRWARASAASKCCSAAPPLLPTCIISRTWWPKWPRKRACAACWARPSSSSRWPTTRLLPMRCNSPKSISRDSATTRW
jgi:hypothetical protein